MRQTKKNDRPHMPKGQHREKEPWGGNPGPLVSIIQLQYHETEMTVKARKVRYPYIEKQAEVCGGRAVIEGTRIAVWLLFRRYRAGQFPEEIQAAYPHLSLSQIHEALAYAFDHLEEMQADLEANAEETWRERLKDSSSPSS